MGQTSSLSISRCCTCPGSSCPAVSSMVSAFAVTEAALVGRDFDLTLLLDKIPRITSLISRSTRPNCHDTKIYLKLSIQLQK